ncbi:DgyrCDS11318 [Dimorphilus gyrociliatus]|uniref:DgyrCDS11318 n=1 Tax=Dimorphilus gyrociliatus TaxID=2664684 RepID=A0A7I8W2W8_9ANNE|nr:DgyrCDS11318 [Dimorphilus gyrociliatus]
MERELQEALSNVHILNIAKKQEQNLKDYEAFETTFEFVIPELQISLSNKDQSVDGVKRDSDGDFILKRERKLKRGNEISITHAQCTLIKDVGLQVWHSSLLLCELLIDQRQKLKNEDIIELGSGVGLAGIIGGIFAKTVICTDKGENILKLCEKNIENNKKFLKEGSTVLTKEINWEETLLELLKWDTEERRIAEEAKYIIAADVVYNEDLTNAFFRTVFQLLTIGRWNKILYIAIEKRINFTLNNLAVCCEAYEHFKTCLEELDGYEFIKESNDVIHDNLLPRVKFNVNQVDIKEIEVYMDYERSRFLVIC